MPVLFLGHGSPMNAIEDNGFRRSWTELARRLPRPTAVVCISAHWETGGDVFVTSGDTPTTIHDFYGFPQALFDVRYPAPGAPGIAARVQELIRAARVHADADRGLDHGAWAVLMPMYPDADVPVVQLSLDTTKPAQFHYDLARQLAPLRDEGVLIVGSGNIVHNLRLWRGPGAALYEWALRFDERVASCIDERRHRDLVQWESLGPEAPLAIPTLEHYLPLLYPLALQQDGESAELFNRGGESSLSMTSVLIGG